VIWVSELTEKVMAAVPWNDTAVAPVKLRPVIVTSAPIGPLDGATEMTVGGGMTVNELPIPVPIGVVTEIAPVVAPTGTVAVIWVSDVAEKTEAAVPWKATAVAPVKLRPVIVTPVPIGPLDGATEVMVGAGMTANELPVPVPLGVVTEIAPDVAPAGTVAEICVSELTVKVIAAVPWNDTAVAPVKLRPVIDTTAPIGPLDGATVVTVGAGMTAKELPVPVPLGVVTEIAPVVAPAGTVAEICVSELTVKVMAAVPWNDTIVAPVKLMPVIVTAAPIGPLDGTTVLTVGAGMTVNKLPTPVPFGVVTEIAPVVAPTGTVAMIWVPEVTETVVAGVPWNATIVVPLRLVPVIVTTVPIGPLDGATEVIVGAGMTANELPVPVPLGVVTEIAPVEAPTGTVAVIWVSVLTVKVMAAVPWNATAVAPVKLMPVIVTTAPIGPLVGATEVTVGAGMTVKELPVPVPLGVVTEIAPVVAPAGTVAEICVSELTVKVMAAAPWNDTAVAAVKLRPVIVTTAPIGPLAGRTVVTVGGGMTVNELPIPVPIGVVTDIAPVVVPTATVALIWVSEVTEKAEAVVPLKATAVAPVKAEPLIVTTVPTGPLGGATEVTVGGGMTVNGVLVAVRPHEVMMIGPVVAPLGIVTVMPVSAVTVKEVAWMPLMVTRLVPVKALPVKFTTVPTGPLLGAIAVIVG
jgi:arylamine N-acetyltransferase